MTKNKDLICSSAAEKAGDSLDLQENPQPAVGLNFRGRVKLKYIYKVPTMKPGLSEH